VGMSSYALDIESDITFMIDNFIIKEAELLQDLIDYGNVMASVFEPFDRVAVELYKTIGSGYKKDPDV